MTAGPDVRVVGTQLPVLVDEPLTINDFVRYQGASGDMNPIHHDPAFAEAAGFPSPFAVGMRQAGVLAAYLERWFGDDGVRRFKVRFLEQAWPGDVLTYGAEVVGVGEEGGEQVVELTARVTRQTGGDHLVAWATYVVARLPT